MSLEITKELEINSMLYQTLIKYRGKLVHISTLKPKSVKKIEIICPECGKYYERDFRILANSGNFNCQKCSIKETIGVRPEIGFSISKLLLIAHTKNYSNSKYLCKCGNIKVLENTRVLSGHVKSCGCLKVETMLYAKSKQDHTKELHPNWRGGISTKENLIRSSKKYQKWRLDVFKRDNYCCLKCKSDKNKLHAHHICEFKNNENLIFEVSNGATFCEECHRKFHSIYGRNNLSQIEFCEYIKRE